MSGGRVACPLLYSCAPGDQLNWTISGAVVSTNASLDPYSPVSVGDWGHDLGGGLWAGGLLSAEAQQAELGWAGLEWPWLGGRLHFSLLLASGRNRQVETCESRVWPRSFWKLRTGPAPLLSFCLGGFASLPTNKPFSRMRQARHSRDLQLLGEDREISIPRGSQLIGTPIPLYEKIKPR